MGDLGIEMEVNSGRFGPVGATWHIKPPFQLVSGEGLGFSQAVGLLLDAAVEAGETPRSRFADGMPVVYHVKAEAGGLYDSETDVVLMPTKPAEKA